MLLGQQCLLLIISFSKYENQYSDIKRSINKKMWTIKFIENINDKYDRHFLTATIMKWVSFNDLFSESYMRSNISILYSTENTIFEEHG